MSVPTTEEAAPTEPLSERRERLVDRKANRPIVKIVPDRRRHRRVPVGVVGRFMREDKREYPCQVVNMSAGGMAILAPVTCAVGERIVAYLDNLGRMKVSWCAPSRVASPCVSWLVSTSGNGSQIC